MRLNLDIDEPTLAKVGGKVGAPFNVNILCTQPQSVDMFPQTAKSHSKTARTPPPKAAVY